MARRRSALGARGELLEEPWQATVIGAAELYGWRHYHTRDSRRSVAGFPDLTLVRVGQPARHEPSGASGRAAELLFVELKTDSGRTTREQDAWLEDLGVIAAAVTELVREVAGKRVIPVVAVEAHVWRPRDWLEVERRLAAGRHRLPPVSGPLAGAS